MLPYIAYMDPMGNHPLWDINEISMVFIWAKYGSFTRKWEVNKPSINVGLYIYNGLGFHKLHGTETDQNLRNSKLRVFLMFQTKVLVLQNPVVNHRFSH